MRRVLCLGVVVVCGAALLVLAGIWLAPLSRDSTRPTVTAVQPAASAVTPSELLERVIHLDSHPSAQLSLETRELLYELHQQTHVLTFEVPRGGVLDTAVGVDPLLPRVGRGAIDFDISLLRGGETVPLFAHTVAVGPETGDTVWTPVTVDLSAYAETRIELEFRTTARLEDDSTPWPYDLGPGDFAFWAKPRARPSSLDRPNVLLISLDTLRADHLHLFGYSRPTSPRLDAFANRSVAFTSCVSQAPWTRPSHLSLFTSTYPSTHGGNQPLHLTDGSWNDTLPTLADILRDQGWATAAFTGRGSISAVYGLAKGFDFYNETSSLPGDTDVAEVTSKAMAWVEQNRDRSFFLFVHTYEPHAPYRDNTFVERDGVPADDEIALRTARYDGDIRVADHHIGRLLDRFEQLGLLDGTVIVVTSDHGEDLGGRNPPGAAIQFGHGHNLFDELLLVPLLIRYPASLPAGTRVDSQVRLIDVLPTLLDVLGFDPPEHLEGTSLRDLINGRDRSDRLAYSEATNLGAECESLRTRDAKLIRRLSYGQLAHPLSRGMELPPEIQLYDLHADPGEKANLADSRPREVETLLRAIGEFSKSSKPRRERRSPASRVEPELREELRALGYVP